MKKSVTYDHFPLVVRQDQRFWLYNPILKKRYENRPEENIRLRWVEYLLHQTDWKKTRIGFETPVKLRHRENKLRADLLLYSDEMKPVILIECKSDSVKLNHLAAEQAARYNSEIEADYLVLTNGIEDYWYEKNGRDIDQASSILNEKRSLLEADRDADYWSGRGFCSSKSDQKVTRWLVKALFFYWFDETETGGVRKYLDFKTSVLPTPMNHYYKVFKIDSTRNLALTFLGTKSTSSFLVGILNEDGKNRGIISINLDRIHDQIEDSIHLFTGNQKKTVPTSEIKGFEISEFEPEQMKNLPDLMINFFD